MDRRDKQARIDARRWYHSIEIEPGLVTPGYLALDVLRGKLQRLQLPARLDGLSVLDIGAWDGFFSFEAERRGAARVVAYDLTPADHFGFQTAKELLGSRVEYVQGSAYELTPERVGGEFDVVLFLGVFYHLRYPLLALDRIFEVCRQYLILETQCMDERIVLADGKSVPLRQLHKRLTEVPLFRFYRKDEMNPGDFSNWFSPNKKAIEECLWSAGFEPTHLASWGPRTAYKAVKRPGEPEYRRQTYEGYSCRGGF